MNYKREEDLKQEQIEELKNQWFSMEEAIDELAIGENKITESSFRREAKRVNLNKDFAQIGKPQIKDEKLDGKGRPRKLYNRAFIEALRSFAISDTYIRFEEVPIEYFASKEWRENLEVEFKDVLDNYVDSKFVYGAINELTRIVGENIISKLIGSIAQNKLLIHHNKKLEDTKEYYIALYRGVEENANLLNDLTKFIKSDISDSSALLISKEAYHSKLTFNVNEKLEEIVKLLEEVKSSDK